MKISDFMQENRVLLNLPSENKEDVIKELISPIIENGIASSQKTLIKAVLDREKLGSTAIGKGVAIPHAKNACVKEKAIIFGRSKNGIDFDSVDGNPELVFQAIVYDPLTASVLSLAEIKEMVRKMLRQNQKYLPQFKNIKI